MIRKHRKLIALILAVIQVVLLVVIIKIKGTDYIAFSVTDGSLIGSIGIFFPAILALIALASGPAGSIEDDIKAAEAKKAAEAPVEPPKKKKEIDYLEGVFDDDNNQDA